MPLQPFFGIKMRYLVNAGEMKQYDKNTIEILGIPGMVLMERAALETFRVLREKGRIFTDAKVFLSAGYGNNGGDGLALARLLTIAGMKVFIKLVGSEEKATEQWVQQKAILEHFEVEFVTAPSLPSYDIIVDALFGVGLSRDLAGQFKEAVEELNSLQGYKVAMDLPSGIGSDDGSVKGVAFRADLTVTYGFEKIGLYLYPGCDYAGEVCCCDVGIPEKAFLDEMPGMFYLEEDMEKLLPVRTGAGNKGTFGKALVIAGSYQMAGAAILCANACYRMGAGMVKVLGPSENREILQTSLPEAMLGGYHDLDDSLAWCDVICIGPGIGKSEDAKVVLRAVMMNSDKPLLIDADGINLLSLQTELLEALKQQTLAGREIVLTPHMGEFKRIYEAAFPGEVGITIQDIKAHIQQRGQKLAECLHCVIAAKDARTIVFREGKQKCLNFAGNSGMATAGSGDVLAGVITALMAQGENAFMAACKGVRIHALAGDAGKRSVGEHGLMASDLVKHLDGRMETWN